MVLLLLLQAGYEYEKSYVDFFPFYIEFCLLPAACPPAMLRCDMLCCATTVLLALLLLLQMRLLLICDPF